MTKYATSYGHYLIIKDSPVARLHECRRSDFDGCVRCAGFHGFETASVALSVFVPEALPPLFSNTVQLELTLLNVMTNAARSMPDAGSLTITADTTV